MSNQVVKVKRETLEACMTCPLCKKLLRDATTIYECLHTFCRKCIHKKLTDDEYECCPICEIDLGCVPLEKLRPDHNIQDLRAKIFPLKRRKVKEPETVPSVTLPPVRRKERSLSSLVVSTPRVAATHTATTLTGRRSKATARKTLRSSSFSIDKQHHVKKEEDSSEDHQESSSSRETLTKFTQNIRQNSSAADPSRVVLHDDETDNGDEGAEPKTDLWKPLNFLVEVANRSKSSKFTSEGSSAKSEPVNALNIEGHNRKTKVKEPSQRSNTAQDENNSPADTSSLLESMKPKKLRRNRQKKSAATFGESVLSPQAVLDSANGGLERKINQIWFSLVASEEQEGHTTLPQIPANYLRIKNGNVPVSFIQKYLVRKLNLTSEDEVEIKCMGQSVVPTLQLSNLVELWIQTGTTPERVPATIGSSGKDFVMVLAYCRKVSSS